MKSVAVLISLVAFACVALADDRAVIVVTGEKAITANPKTIVRVTGSGPSGKTDVSATVKGPGKLVNTNTVREFKNGSPVIGSFIKEFEVALQKAGVVEITVTVTNKLDNTTTKTTYTINVEAPK